MDGKRKSAVNKLRSISNKKGNHKSRWKGSHAETKKFRKRSSLHIKERNKRLNRRIPSETIPDKCYQESFIQYARNILSGKNDKLICSPGGIEVFRQFVGDTDTEVQALAVGGLARISECSEELATLIVHQKCIQMLAHHCQHSHPDVKRACLDVVKATCHYNSKIALAIIDAGGFKIVADFLQDKDTEVVTTAVKVTNQIATTSKEVIHRAIQYGITQALYNLISNHKNVETRVYSAMTLISMVPLVPNVSRHFDEHSVCSLVGCMKNSDYRIKVQTAKVITKIINFDPTKAKCIMSVNVSSDLQNLLRMANYKIKMLAAKMIAVITKHLPQAIEMMSETSHNLFMMLVSLSKTALPALEALGNMASGSPDFAEFLLIYPRILLFTNFLKYETRTAVKDAAVTTLFHAGKHSPIHANALLRGNTSQLLIKTYTNQKNALIVQKKCKLILQVTVPLCTEMDTTVCLLLTLPIDILGYAILQLWRHLNMRPEAEQEFLHMGGNAALQRIGLQSLLDLSTMMRAWSYLQKALQTHKHPSTEKTTTLIENHNYVN